MVAQGWSFEVKIESTSQFPFSGGVELGFVAAAPDTLSLPLPRSITSLTLASKAPLGAWCLDYAWTCFAACDPDTLPAGTRIRVMLHFDARVSVWVDGKRMGPAPPLKKVWSSASLLKPGSTQLWGVVGVYGKHESISLIPDAGVAVQASSPTPHASPSAESKAGEESPKKTAAAVPGQGMAAAAPSACAAAVEHRALAAAVQTQHSQHHSQAAAAAVTAVADSVANEPATWKTVANLLVAARLSTCVMPDFVKGVGDGGHG